MFNQMWPNNASEHANKTKQNPQTNMTTVDIIIY